MSHRQQWPSSMWSAYQELDQLIAYEKAVRPAFRETLARACSGVEAEIDKLLEQRPSGQPSPLREENERLKDALKSMVQHVGTANTAKPILELLGYAATGGAA